MTAADAEEAAADAADICIDAGAAATAYAADAAAAAVDAVAAAAFSAAGGVTATSSAADAADAAAAGAAAGAAGAAGVQLQHDPADAFIEAMASQLQALIAEMLQLMPQYHQHKQQLIGALTLALGEPIALAADGVYHRAIRCMTPFGCAFLVVA